MSHDLKRALLEIIYDVYAGTVKRFDAACRKGCSACCTHNVIATTVEVDMVMDFLQEVDRNDLLGRVLEETRGKRLQPALTINGLAEYCLSKKDPPQEVEELDQRPCPLLEEETCPIYPVRPFGCRALRSAEPCEGEAIMPPLLVTFNGLFQQMIEDIDRGGLYGNMIDLFAALNRPERRSAYRSGRRLEPLAGLSATVPNPGFIVPPEHRLDVVALFNTLWVKEIDGLSFKEAVEAVRGPGGSIDTP